MLSVPQRDVAPVRPPYPFTTVTCRAIPPDWGVNVLPDTDAFPLDVSNEKNPASSVTIVKV